MARHHEAVAWRWRAARSCWAACFLIELRCALWASPPSITAFVLPALLCQSVRAALVRPAQGQGSYIASASQVLVSALVRRCGFGSLSHRAGGAVASSVTMCPRESLRFVTEAHRHLSPVCEAGCASQPQRRSTALAKSHQMKASASQDGSQSAVALGVGHGSLAHRAGIPVRPSVLNLQLRQNYITPHCPQCPPVSRKLLLWQPPLRALRVKATGVMQNCRSWSGRQSSALPGRFAPYAPPPVALLVC